MATPAERRAVIRILLDSAFYCGTLYRMPLRERLALVKMLEKQLADRDGQPVHPQQGRRIHQV